MSRNPARRQVAGGERGSRPERLHSPGHLAEIAARWDVTRG